MALFAYNGLVEKDNFRESLQLTYYHSIVFTVLLASLITGVMVIKSWYRQVEENTDLYQQKVYNELNLLKSNIYPAFLFNSLSSLRDQLDVSSTKAAKLLLNLSDILSYLLYDSQNEQVPLKKEIMIIKKFIEALKPEWGNSIEFADHISEEADNKFIPPLILFSLLQTVLPETNKPENQNPFVQIAVSPDKNDFIQLMICCRFNESPVTDRFREKEIKKIEERLAVFSMADKRLTILNNESDTRFSILVKTTGSFNFSNNGTELKN